MLITPNIMPTIGAPFLTSSNRSLVLASSKSRPTRFRITASNERGPTEPTDPSWYRVFVRTNRGPMPQTGGWSRLPSGGLTAIYSRFASGVELGVSDKRRSDRPAVAAELARSSDRRVSSEWSATRWAQLPVDLGEMEVKPCRPYSVGVRRSAYPDRTVGRSVGRCPIVGLVSVNSRQAVERAMDVCPTAHAGTVALVWRGLRGSSTSLCEDSDASPLDTSHDWCLVRVARSMFIGTIWTVRTAKELCTSVVYLHWILGDSFADGSPASAIIVSLHAEHHYVDLAWPRFRPL